jgi:hypothetical protein
MSSDPWFYFSFTMKFCFSVFSFLFNHPKRRSKSKRALPGGIDEGEIIVSLYASPEEPSEQQDYHQTSVKNTLPGSFNDEKEIIVCSYSSPEGSKGKRPYQQDHQRTPIKRARSIASTLQSVSTQSQHEETPKKPSYSQVVSGQSSTSQQTDTPHQSTSNQVPDATDTVTSPDTSTSNPPIPPTLPPKEDPQPNESAKESTSSKKPMQTIKSKSKVSWTFSQKLAICMTHTRYCRCIDTNKCPYHLFFWHTPHAMYVLIQKTCHPEDIFTTSVSLEQPMEYMGLDQLGKLVPLILYQLLQHPERRHLQIVIRLSSDSEAYYMATHLENQFNQETAKIFVLSIGKYFRVNMEEANTTIIYSTKELEEHINAASKASHLFM